MNPRTIPGWGSDLDPAKRPGVPREQDPALTHTGAHWNEPEQQQPKIQVLVSNEHKGLTPVFGTSCPPKGASGLIRRLAFRRSEGQKSHWLLLLLADRVNVVEGTLGAFARGRPDNPISEMGLASELRPNGFTSRFGQHRYDVRRWRNQAVAVTGVIGVGALLASRVMNRIESGVKAAD